MNTILKKALAGIMIVALVGVFSLLNASAEETNPAPADLLGEAYNPFYHVDLPLVFTISSAMYEQESHCYTLDIDAVDTAENVVTVVLNLLGNNDSDNIRLGTDTLQNAAVVSMKKTDIQTGESISCEINDYNRDGVFSVILTQLVTDSSTLDAFLAANTNIEALGGTASSFDFSAAKQKNLILFVNDAVAVLRYMFTLENAEEVKADLLKVFDDDYRKESDELMLRYGDMDIRVKFESASDGIIYIEQQMDTMDVCFGSYIPPTTLRNFGFEFWEENSTCDYHDDRNGVYLNINKLEWRENENTDGTNSIGFTKDMGDNGYWVSYYPINDTFSVSINLGEQTLEYTCMRTGDLYTFIIQNDFNSAMTIARQLFPDSNNTLLEPVIAFEDYIFNTFGMSPSELYTVDFE